MCFWAMLWMAFGLCCAMLTKTRFWAMLYTPHLDLTPIKPTTYDVFTTRNSCIIVYFTAFPLSLNFAQIPRIFAFLRVNIAQYRTISHNTVQFRIKAVQKSYKLRINLRKNLYLRGIRRDSGDFSLKSHTYSRIFAPLYHFHTQNCIESVQK